MRRQSFKPDASFFEKIAIGAIGAKAVQENLQQHGHDLRELERGATDTKLWKEVKRKRVRIPDLVCLKCGRRFESRAKTDNKLAMSHSPSEAERSWDYGMVDDDVIAFPVCMADDKQYESTGRLSDSISYWRERNWQKWDVQGYINYFTVRSFRATPADDTSIKGVTEGAETSLLWSAIFASNAGVVESIQGAGIRIRFDSGKCYTWQNKSNLPIAVQEGQRVQSGQVIASRVEPLSSQIPDCPNDLSTKEIMRLLESHERTLRFTGIKLARLRLEQDHSSKIEGLAEDPDEDMYIRMEASSYLSTVCQWPVRDLFAPYLRHAEPQIQLEAVITLAEVPTEEAVEIMSELLESQDSPFFLRSAAAWSLSRIGGLTAVQRLLGAFADVEYSIREEALVGVTSIGNTALPHLLDGLVGKNAEIAAGCAEALREQGSLPDEIISQLAKDVCNVTHHPWITWLLGNLPRDRVIPLIAEYQESRPELHYALSVLWAFTESWIAQQWELQTPGTFPLGRHIHD